jgi:uncharacterized protein
MVAATMAASGESLIFRVEEIPEEGLSGKRMLQPSWFSIPSEGGDADPSIKLVEPIVIMFFLQRIGKDVMLNLSVSTTASMTCSRCLKIFPYPIESQSRFTLCEANQNPPLEKDMELELEHLESGTFEGGEIDLSHLIYEQIVLSFPIKALCREDCKGLCPQCGADRNRKACGCITAKSDPRWEALKKFKTSSTSPGAKDIKL